MEITSLDQITPEMVSRQQILLTQFIQDTYPDIDISKGVLHDLVLHLYAIFAAKTEGTLARYKSAQSLLAISKEPALAEDGVADNIFSNYNITRKSETYSTGRLLMRFSRDVSVLITSASRFYYQNDSYRAAENVVVYSSSSGAHDTLIQLSDNSFGYYVKVVAEAPGATSFVGGGSEFTSDTEFANLISITAETDFTIGTDRESNDLVLKRLADGMATPCWGNRANIHNMISQSFPDLVDISVIGMGDVEMTRDKSTLFPISTGGKADIYVKTSPTLTTSTITTTATLLRIEKGMAIWSVFLQGLPGCYRVTNVRWQERPCDILTHTVTGTHYTANQKLFLEFQTELIHDVSRLEVALTVVGQSSVEAIQALFQDRHYMPVTADALVRAAYPQFLDIDLTLTHNSGNEEAIRNTLTNYINTTGFVSVITSAELARALAPVLEADQLIYTLRISSEVWGGDNKVYRAFGCEVAETPKDPLNGVTPRTTVFYARDINLYYRS